MIYVFYISPFVFSHPVFNRALHFTNICFIAWTADHVYYIFCFTGDEVVHVSSLTCDWKDDTFWFLFNLKLTQFPHLKFSVCQYVEPFRQSCPLRSFLS